MNDNLDEVGFFDIDDECSMNQEVLAQVDSYLFSFAQQMPAVRDALARTIPAYNKMLQFGLSARTFEDMALVPYAKAQGLNVDDPLFSFRDVKPPCIKCGSFKRISRIKENKYHCSKCNKNFSLNKNSIVSGSSRSALQYMQVLQSLLDGFTVDRAMKLIGTKSTDSYYYILYRLFYAMRIMLNDVRLYGDTYNDLKLEPASYRGYRLTDSTDYPEDSPFDAPDYLPRPPKDRGGDKRIKSTAETGPLDYYLPGADLAKVQIFTAIDDYGHCFARYVCLGRASASKLKWAVPYDIYLPEVPKRDPFPYTKKAISSRETAGKKTKLILDKESGLIKYVEDSGFLFEAHVYRRDGVQLKRKVHIQKVNSLHSRLKKFLRLHNCSSSTLPGYLDLFSFIENTGASPAAIRRLFEILNTPGLGLPPGEYKKLFQIPNAYFELIRDNALLARLKEHQAWAVYLYHQKRQQEERKDPHPIKWEEILSRTGYKTPAMVRRLYKNIVASGGIDIVCQYIESGTKPVIDKGSASKSGVGKQQKPFDEETVGLACVLYDEYRDLLVNISVIRHPLRTFVNKVNEKHQTTFTRSQMLRLFEYLERCGLRHGNIHKLIRDNMKKRPYGPKQIKRVLQCIYARHEIKLACAERGIELGYHDMLAEIYERTGISPGLSNIYLAKSKHLVAAGLILPSELPEGALQDEEKGEQ